MLYIICGLQGTGKTTVAKKLSERVNGILLRTDAIRKEIIDKPTHSEEEKRRVYEEMLLRARQLIEKGKDVILDATFSKRVYRDEAKKISKGKYIIIETVCPEEIAKERLETRDEIGANYKTHLKCKKNFEPVEEEHVIIDTSKDIDRQLEKFVFN